MEQSKALGTFKAWSFFTLNCGKDAPAVSSEQALSDGPLRIMKIV
jgi:hypothetical protein